MEHKVRGGLGALRIYDTTCGSHSAGTEGLGGVRKDRQGAGPERLVRGKE